ncbi:MAG: ATPase [Clostridiales bacterium]|jgi:vacuolar-type H+-ATPase subunit H|nr:ATPase [Clostridiales bacterium]
MDILELIDNLEDAVEKGLNIPLAGKCLLDKDELLDLIQEMRLKLPDDLKQAKWVKDERQRILLEAQKEANDIIKSTEDKIISMINENEITKRAKAQAEEIIGNAAKRSKEIKQGTRKYADDVLADMEKIMEQTLSTLRNNRIELHDKEAKKITRGEDSGAGQDEE